jgi:NitT/TauT family transport system substrate-binding protein
LVKAEAFVAKHPDEAQTIVAAATKVEGKLVRQVWDAFQYRVVLDWSLIITLEDETRWAMKRKLTDKTVMPDYASYIYSDGLKAVKPDAVMMNR